MEMRTKAVNELQQRYPEYLGNLSKEKILAGETADAEIRLNDALVKRGIALASQQAIQDEINNSLKNQKWLSDQLNGIEIKRLELGKRLSALDPFSKNEEVQQIYNDLTQQLTRLFYLEGTLKEQYDNKNKTIQDSIKYYLQQYNANAKYLDVVREEEKATKDGTKAKREDIEAITLQTESQQGLLAKLKEQKKGFQDLQQQTSNTNKEFKDFQTIIDGIQQSIDLIEDPSKVITTTGVDEFMKRYSNSVQTSLEESKGFWEQYGQEVTDLSQELINTLAEISNQRFETQLANLEKERDIAILFAGESASAREEIERQYEERRAQIQKRQAEAQKKLAIFNIITDTAQAVIATLAQTPPPAGIPLAVLVGAIGAAQLALVASQPPPQFAKGTDNAPEGWAITQEKGREIITDKSGKVKSLGNDKGAQYTYLNKGDKVFTNADTEAMMFNSNLNNMLLGNGIVMPKVDVSISTQAIENKLDNLTSVISNKEGLTIVRDERGERKYLRKQAETKELLNNVLTYKGIDV
jgi:hypothetical protein